MIRKIYFGVLPKLVQPAKMMATLKKLKDDQQLSQEDINSILGTQDLKQEQKPFMKIQKQDSQLVFGQQQQSSLTQNKKDYFYGLMPQFNENYPICKDPQQVIIQQTPNQNLYRELNLTVDSSFADYTDALQKYRTQIDLYGDQSPKSIIQNQSLEFKQLLVPDSEYLQKLRDRHLVNISIPGTIQCEDPRNFMELRPIQQFRHTPLVPISQSAMQKHKQMLERYHRKQFIFQVKKQSIVNGLLMSIAFSLGGYFVYRILQKEEQRTVSYSRMKYQRIKGQSSEQPIFRI